jgi:hypothetical protein
VIDPHDIAIGARVIVKDLGRTFEAEVVRSKTRTKTGQVTVRRADTGKILAVASTRCRPAEREPTRPAAPPPEVVERATTERPELAAQPKTRRHQNPAYLGFVRAKPCCACGAPPQSDPHHWSIRGRKGIALKPDDERTVPLCRGCHDHFHAHTTLPELTPAKTAVFFLSVQTDLMAEWIRLLTDGAAA